jgi:hypothetical protein
MTLRLSGMVGAAIVLVAAAVTAPAMADPMNPSDWSSSGLGSTSVSAITGGVELDYSYAVPYAGLYGPVWDFTTVAPTTGTLSFDYQQTANYAYYAASGSLDLIDVTSGASENLNTSPGTIGVPPITGSGSLFVTAGDTVEIQAYAINFDYQAFVGGTVQLTDIAIVPEPMTLTLLGAGLAGLGVVRRKRA